MTAAPIAEAFEAALSGEPTMLIGADGRQLPSAVARWHGSAGGDDHWMLDRCTGPTVDLGCGPGRLATALLHRGVYALGVDCSGRAVRECLRRGGFVLRSDVFDPLPREGRWQQVLLADGNIGIGGDPVALLRRCVGLLRLGGSVLVEAERPGTGCWQGLARVQHRDNATSTGPWFQWATVSLDELGRFAKRAGLQICARHVGRRCFAELRRCDR